MIRPVLPEDADQIAEIYNDYILNTPITFEEVAISGDIIRLRIQDVTGDGCPWIVFVNADQLVGYAYASKWHIRNSYRYSVEPTIYLDRRMTGRGVGKQLFTALLEMLKDCGFHTAIGLIALPNPASVRLHESLGFTKVAHLKEVGFKLNRWIDVGYWQKIL